MSFIDEAAWRISVNSRVRARGRRIREVGIQFLPVGWRNPFSTYNFAGGVANKKSWTARARRRQLWRRQNGVIETVVHDGSRERRA